MNNNQTILLWQHNYIPIKRWDVFKYLQPTFPFLLLYDRANIIRNPSVYFCLELPFYANHVITSW